MLWNKDKDRHVPGRFDAPIGVSRDISASACLISFVCRYVVDARFPKPESGYSSTAATLGLQELQPDPSPPAAGSDHRASGYIAPNTPHFANGTRLSWG